MSGHPRKLGRRSFALLLAALPFAAASQDYPTKPVRLVVPYSAGAITDLGARLVAERMSQILGQQVVVDNRAGAGTRIGMQLVASAPADGYTLLFANSVTHGTMPAMSKSLAVDPLKDFVPVARVFTYNSILVCHPSTPATTVRELVDYATKNPGKLTNATAGPGTGHDLMGGLFNSLTGANMLHVHYRGAAPALQDVLAGTANCIYGGGDVKQYVQSGKLKAFASGGSQRDPDFPNVPTMEEAGVKGFSITWWQGLAAPAGTPPAVVARLAAAANEALKSPDLLAKARTLSLIPAGSTPQQLGQVMRDDMALYAKIVKDARIEQQD
ncbi:MULTISPECIES: tripartite tricarboxylate transporter substrate-binding protein [Ramlibacter]|uniref:Tripartite tricarboxylate transporter substrate binding protein n=1 Tax=Ramlibacter pinisoli TaxID=2682844 RepID=A0A6N8IPU0_9BURK|nr:tripartite tricarboxylate transporter substrate binding protein [Ramlibacter sp. CGMCC 1.13660]MVQ28891.1 tripartite tricarboxylate transporter substrate binding protein [Ramlibacter pinisoli]